MHSDRKAFRIRISEKQRTIKVHKRAETHLHFQKRPSFCRRLLLGAFFLFLIPIPIPCRQEEKLEILHTPLVTTKKCPKAASNPHIYRIYQTLVTF